MPRSQFDPWNSYYFALEINGREIAHFLECSGIKTSSEVFVIEEGGFNGHVHSRPGQSRWENLVLKTATNISMELLRWRDEFIQDKFETRPDNTGAVVMRSNDGQELRRFNFVNAWPVSWEGPTLNSDGSELAVETLEIAHEGIFIGDLPPPTPPEPEPEPDPETPLDLPPIQFEYNSSELSAEGRETVNDIDEQLAERGIQEFWVEGHTCTMGSFGYNASLSADRAETVKQELLSKDPSRQVYAQGFAWKYPVSSNATNSGKEANRRTEFFTSSYAARGRSPDPVTPESKKSESPWNHR